MKKIFYIFLSFIASAPIALAHFESPHEPFWHEPMHFIVGHYSGLMLIAAGALTIVISRTRKKTKHNEKVK